MKESKLIAKLDTSSDTHEIAYANTWEKPNCLHNNYTVEVKCSSECRARPWQKKVDNGQEAGCPES
jgi:hypothetical protein